MSSTRNTPVMGTIVGFSLVLDSETDHPHRLDFQKARSMMICMEDAESQYALLTVIHRDDTGQTEEQEGVDFSGDTVVGTRRVKLFCKCGVSHWFDDRPNTPPESRDYVCGHCLPDDDRTVIDADMYDGMNEREH